MNLCYGGNLGESETSLLDIVLKDFSVLARNIFD